MTALRETGSVQVTWPAVPGATKYTMQRRHLGPTGWSAWTPCAGLEAATLSWTDPAATAATAYRLRALGPDNRRSDWSRTLYAR